MEHADVQKSLLAAKNISALNIIKEYSTHQTPSQWPFEHNWAQAFTNIDLAQASPASTFFSSLKYLTKARAPFEAIHYGNTIFSTKLPLFRIARLLRQIYDLQTFVHDECSSCRDDAAFALVEQPLELCACDSRAHSGIELLEQFAHALPIVIQFGPLRGSAL